MAGVLDRDIWIGFGRGIGKYSVGVARELHAPDLRKRKQTKLEGVLFRCVLPPLHHLKRTWRGGYDIPLRILLSQILLPDHSIHWGCVSVVPILLS